MKITKKRLQSSKKLTKKRRRIITNKYKGGTNISNNDDKLIKLFNSFKVNNTKDSLVIPFEQINNFIKSTGNNIKGILHIGAHELEERIHYNNIGIDDSKIIWIEGNPAIVEQNKNKGVTIYQALIDEEEKEIMFYITNNGHSSSILELGTHANAYPNIKVTEPIKLKTIRLDNFFETNNIDPNNYDFWNLDIQGAELRALKSAGKYLENVKYIYTEVFIKELYKGSALLPDVDAFLKIHGFTRIATQLHDVGWGEAFYFKNSISKL